MYKTALAALSLALSFGLMTVAVSAQDQNQSGQNQNGNTYDDGSNNKSNTGGNGTNNGSGTDSNSNSNNQTPATVTNSKPKPSTTTSTTTTQTPTATATTKPVTPPSPQVQVQTYGKYASTQKVSSVTTSTSTTKTTGVAKAGSATTVSTTSTTKKIANKDELVTLQESGDKKYVSTKKNQWQTIETYIQLKPGQESLPLTMTVTNVGYTGINMLLAGSKLATDKDFKSNSLRMQMTGALAAGDNKLSVQVFGPVGANLSWKLTTLKPVISAFKPVNGATTEEEVTLQGRNFAKVASGNVVYVGQKFGVVKSATTKEIVFTLPKDVQAGKQTIIVSVGGIQSKGIEFMIKFAPEVSGISLLSGPPGQEFSISGKGFSPVQSENIVTVGGVPAQIISSTTQRITATIPEMNFPQWNLPVLVKAGGVESKPSVKINIQSRVIPNDGVPES